MASEHRGHSDLLAVTSTQQYLADRVVGEVSRVNVRLSPRFHPHSAVLARDSRDEYPTGEAPISVLPAATKELRPPKARNVVQAAFGSASAPASLRELARKKIKKKD